MSLQCRSNTGWRYTLVHRKKKFTSFPSPAGMSLTKLPLDRNNSVMTSLFPPGRVWWWHPGWGRETREPFFYGVDLQSLFGLHVQCTAVLIDWGPATSPHPPRIWAHIRGRYGSARIDSIFLWPLGLQAQRRGRGLWPFLCVCDSSRLILKTFFIVPSPKWV